MAKYIEVSDAVLRCLFGEGSPELLVAYLVLVQNRQKNRNYTTAGAKAIQKVLGTRWQTAKVYLGMLQEKTVLDATGQERPIIQTVTQGNQLYKTDYPTKIGLFNCLYLTPAKSNQAKDNIRVSFAVIENTRVNEETGEIQERVPFVREVLNNGHLDDEDKLNYLAQMLWFFKHWDYKKYNGFAPKFTGWIEPELFSEICDRNSVIGLLQDYYQMKEFDNALLDEGGLYWRLVNNNRSRFARKTETVEACAKWRGLEDTSYDVNQHWYFEGIQVMQKAHLIREELVVMSSDAIQGKPLYTLQRPLLCQEHNHPIEKKGLCKLTAYRPVISKLGIGDEHYAELGIGDANHTGFYVMASPKGNPDAQPVWLYRLVDGFNTEEGAAGDELERKRQQNWKVKLIKARNQIAPDDEWEDF